MPCDRVPVVDDHRSDGVDAHLAALRGFDVAECVCRAIPDGRHALALDRHARAVGPLAARDAVLAVGDRSATGRRRCHETQGHRVAHPVTGAPLDDGGRRVSDDRGRRDRGREAEFSSVGGHVSRGLGAVVVRGAHRQAADVGADRARGGLGHGRGLGGVRPRSGPVLERDVDLGGRSHVREIGVQGRGAAGDRGGGLGGDLRRHMRASPSAGSAAPSRCCGAPSRRARRPASARPPPGSRR